MCFFIHLSNAFSGPPDVQITVKSIQTSRFASLALGGPQMPRLRPIRFHHHDVLRFQCGSNGLTTVYQLWSFTALLKKIKLKIKTFGDSVTATLKN